MKIIAYATHSEGYFDELPSDVIVIGFGTKWKGFIEKAKKIKEYLLTLDKDEIVVVIDGFDSIIKRTNDIIELFQEYNCKVLCSMEDKNGLNILPSFIHRYLVKKVFGICKDNKTANSGLCMGYNEYLQQIFDTMITGTSDDDQRNVNVACDILPFLKIDTRNKIFENCSSMAEVENSNACICQLPAKLSLNRIKRAIIEYPKFFIPEILFLILIILVSIYYGKRKQTSNKFK
jgi:hypothetical protein